MSRGLKDIYEEASPIFSKWFPNPNTQRYWDYIEEMSPEVNGRGIILDDLPYYKWLIGRTYAGNTFTEREYQIICKLRRHD